jgi:hypothetical protein
MPALPLATGRLRQTNPILRLRIGCRPAGGRRSRAGGRLYKQTQFPTTLGGPAVESIVPNKANFGRSFKCEVSSVKLGKPVSQPSESSYFKLYTSHFPLRRSRRVSRAKQSQFPATLGDPCRKRLPRIAEFAHSVGRIGGGGCSY